MSQTETPAHSLAGMSVTERLAARGLTADWTAAVEARDRQAMTRILMRVAMPDARRVADVVLADPAAYGF